MQPMAAVAVLLFLFGAVAAGILLGRLLGATFGVCVASFYLMVLLNIAPDDRGLGLLQAEVSDI